MEIVALKKKPLKMEDLHRPLRQSSSSNNGNFIQGTLYGHWIDKGPTVSQQDYTSENIIKIQDLRDRFNLLCGGQAYEVPLEEHEISYVPLHNTESSKLDG